MARFSVAVPILSLLLLLFTYSAFLGSQVSYPTGSLPLDAQGGGAGSCRMSYTSPSYLKLTGFGREYTRLGSGPWAVYLYREAGWDKEEPITLKGKVISLSGSPVVFVPGNAGSFRQVRSLAGAASRQFWDAPGVKRKGIGGKGSANLDYFAIDFNEDFSAFHGQTLLDQSEYLADAIRYILTLYPKQDRPDPASVIVVAHSMGGIVARAAFLHPHYQAHSISTLITIATPHVAPPVTVDRGVGRVYQAINEAWRAGSGLEAAKGEAGKIREELLDLVTISISGGLSDVTIAAEATSLASLLPNGDTNGFTVFTTSIPGVSTPIDHLALLWCQQLVSIITDSLLAIVDTRVATGVVSRAERMEILSSNLLGNLESGKKSLSGRRVNYGNLIVDATSQTLARGEQLVIRPEYRLERKVYVLPIPPIKTYRSALTFNLLTSSAISRSQNSQVEVYACSRSVPQDLDDCIALFSTHVTSIPLSLHSKVSPILPGPVEEGTMGFLAVDVAELENQHSIVVVMKAGDAWTIAEFGDKEKRVHVVEKSVTRELQLYFLKKY